MDQKVYETLKEKKRIKKIREWWFGLSFEAKWIMVIRFRDQPYIAHVDETIGDITGYPYCAIDKFDNDIIERLYTLDNI